MQSIKPAAFGGIPVNFPVFLAPMVGLSHVAFRSLVQSYLPEDAQVFWPTEMLNSRRLPHERVGETPETWKHLNENCLVPQILGNEPAPIAASVEKLRDWGAIGIDINMGCPVKKALKHNYGVALMGDANYAAEVVHMTAKASTLPVSVKLRAGLQNDLEYLVRFAQGLETAGAKWIVLHPRIAAQKRRGHADWSQIRELRTQLKIPVIGNGDVQTADDAERMLGETQADGVMVGRALTARPWLLWQLGERWGFQNPRGKDGRSPISPQDEAYEYGRALEFLLGEFERYFPEKLGVVRFRFFLRTGHVWLNFGHRLFALASRTQSYSELRVMLKEFFASPGLEMTPETQLRY